MECSGRVPAPPAIEAGNRTVYPQVPPKVEYRLTGWGKAVCPALDALLEWAARQSKYRARGAFKS